jgi:hypothetical protein
MDTAQLTLLRTPFDDPNFLFELKIDGFRALAYVHEGHCDWCRGVGMRIKVLENCAPSRCVEGQERRA